MKIVEVPLDYSMRLAFSDVPKEDRLEVSYKIINLISNLFDNWSFGEYDSVFKMDEREFEILERYATIGAVKTYILNQFALNKEKKLAYSEAAEKIKKDITVYLLSRQSHL